MWEISQQKKSLYVRLVQRSKVGNVRNKSTKKVTICQISRVIKQGHHPPSSQCFGTDMVY